MVDIICLIIFIAISFAFGKKIAKTIKLSFASFGEEILFSLGFGFGGISFLIFFLGITKLLFSWVILSLLGIIAFLTLPELKEGFASVLKVTLQIKRLKISFLLKFLILILLGHILLNLIGSLAPETGYDPLAYNLLTPKRYLAHHEIYHIPDNAQSCLPMATEMLYVVALSIKRTIFAKLIHFFMGILVILAIIIYSSKYFDSSGKLGLLAAVIFYTQPVIGYVATKAKVDLALAIYCLLIIFAIFNWLYKPDRCGNKWLIASSIFLGLAASTKLTGIILFPMFFLGLFFIFLLNQKYSVSVSLLKAFGYTLIALLIVLPWYIKSFLWTGDPFYPYLSRVLSGTNMTNARLHSVSLLQYLMLPWALTFNIDKFAYGNHWASPYFLAFLPMLFLLKSNKRMIMLLLLSVAFITFFFFSDLVMRYLLPALALLSIVYAFALFRFIQNNQNLKGIVLAIILIFPILSLYSGWRENQHEVPVALGLEKQEEYLSRETKGLYDACVYINNNLSSEAKIFSPWEVRGYYLDREFITGNGSFDRNFTGLSTCQALAQKLKKMGFTHVLKNFNYHNELLDMYAKKQIKINPNANLFYQSDMDNYLRCIYSNKNVFLYEIKD